MWEETDSEAGKFHVEGPAGRWASLEGDGLGWENPLSPQQVQEDP